MSVAGNPADGPIRGDEKVERNQQQRRRVFVWLTSALLTASVFAPAAAWAEMIVKPGH
jgi:hypothetical protein